MANNWFSQTPERRIWLSRKKLDLILKYLYINFILILTRSHISLESQTNLSSKIRGIGFSKQFGIILVFFLLCFGSSLSKGYTSEPKSEESRKSPCVLKQPIASYKGSRLGEANHFSSAYIKECSQRNVLGTSNGTQISQDYVPGEVLVKFKDNVTKERIEEINGIIGTEVIGYFPSIGIYRVKIIGGKGVKGVIKEYLNFPDVEYAEPNYKRRCIY